jgi:RecB family exonuclease
MLEGGAALTRAPAFSAALPHALGRWRERGGLLVVPRREAAARALLDEAGGGAAVMGREAVTFAGLRARVAAAAGVAEVEPPAPIEVRLALREVLDGADLRAFGLSARGPGFLSAIERALAELRAARVPPARVTAAATTATGRALAAIHAAAGAVPLPADALWAAADAARGVAAFPPVTVAAFDDLVPAQWALLHALSRATSVEVVMPFDAGRPAYEARRARQARWEAEAVTVAGARPVEAGYAPLAARLFDDGPPAAGAPPLRLVGAAGTRGMLRAALDEALAAAGEGVPLSEVALVVPRLADVRDDLERLLDDWDVPARMASRLRALEAPLALALTHLLRLGEMDPGAPGALDHLLGWLRTPYSGADPAEVDLFEAGARRGGLARRGELMSRWEGPAIAPARRLVAAARRGPRAQLAAMVDAGWEALRRAGEHEGPPSRADLRDRAALAALGGLAAAVDDEGAGDEAAPGRPRGPLPPGAVGELVADLTVVVREDAPGGLAVHDLASLRGARYEVVVIAGLDGDGVPAGPAADPLLGELREPLADLLPPRAPGTSESRLRFVHAVDAARSRLVLVRRTVDDEGRELAPSPYWVEACRVAGRPFGDLDRVSGARGEVAGSAAEARSEREALRAMALDGLVAPGPLAEAAGRRVREVGVPADAFHDRPRLRVTELEAFLQCPYGWFRDRYLAPVEMEELIDPRFEGTLAHAVLQRAYERMRDAGAGACTPATLDGYRAALEAALPEVCAERRPAGAGAAFDALGERLRRHLRAMLGREADLRSGLVPTHFERTMEDAALAPGVTVAGTVDRLDLGAGGAALVVDYKRTRGDFAASGDDVSRRLQLPLYGLMARRDLGLAAEPAGGLYMGLLTASITGAVCDDVPGAPAVRPALSVSREEWTRLADDALEAAREAVAGIRSGRLDAPDPDACSHWCRCEDLWR